VTSARRSMRLFKEHCSDLYSPAHHKSALSHHVMNREDIQEEGMDGMEEQENQSAAGMGQIPFYQKGILTRESTDEFAELLQANGHAYVPNKVFFIEDFHSVGLY
jgi:hypothetical protein